MFLIYIYGLGNTQGYKKEINLFHGSLVIKSRHNKIWMKHSGIMTMFKTGAM